MRFLPMFVALSRGPVVLAGSGAAALAKLRILGARGAAIRWFPMAQDASAPADLAGSGTIEIRAGEPGARDLDGAVALIAAVGTEADARLAARARQCRIPVNAVDRPELSDFIFPAIVDRGEIIVAIGTGGAAPVLARRLRERIEAVVPERIGELAALIGRWRRRLQWRLSTAGGRDLWERFIDGPLAAAVLEGRSGEAEAWLAAQGKGALGPDPLGHSRGSVTLVGAGPGDPDLLTLKALNALQNADLVFYDELVTPEILNRARREAAKIPVGRRRGHRGPGQDEVSRRLIEAARAGARVVRLKGGDPFVFGRGGEEVAALRAAGIPVSIVPGITAVIGAAAEWQIPLTCRHQASRLMMVTAHRAGDKAPIDWSDMIDPETTVAIYMGLGSAAAIRDRMIAAGRDPATPAAVLARSTRRDSEAFVGPLADLAGLAARAGDGPAILIVGEAVARSKAWRPQPARERVLEPA
jgi:uroporphyrin-III C-methyltransferase / precorrin-2 dehydrogenase / sirohydrochlorin ferrochelatase